MKLKYVFVAAALMIPISTVNAQLMRGYGIKAGIVIANQKWDYSIIPGLKTENRWGFVGGGFVELFDIPYFSLIAEVQYEQKGMKYSVQETTPDQPEGTGRFITSRPRVDYISILAPAKFRIELSGLIPYIFAGPRFDILVYKNGEGFTDIIDKFASTDFGPALGIGMELREETPVHALLEFRYSPSLKNSFKGDLLTIRNRSMEFLLGVEF